ncbi:MAG: NUDIX hydrolase, partial [Fluviicola sp.]|jgi:8-oxo-dGTP pyrophosphatase MutT (NUDIX family)
MNLDQLRVAFERELPGEAAHHEFLPMRGSSQAAIANGAPYRLSAVAILLFQNTAGNLSTIVTQRQTYEGTHSGQISFPGGKFEDFDLDLTQTAVRETREEIGLDISNSERIGKLTNVYIPVSQFLVEPHVFIIQDQPSDFQLSPREVNSLHTLDLPTLFTTESVTLRDIKQPNGIILKQVPHFVQNDLFIWGATALMLNELKAMLQKA